MTGENKKEQELRVKVAELCGWQFVEQGVYVRTYPPGTSRGKIDEMSGMPEGALLIKSELPNARELACKYNAPDYPNNLNACAEFEKGLTDEEMCNNYAVNLGYRVLVGATPGTKPWRIWHATALQRCEAFVKTMEGAK